MKEPIKPQEYRLLATVILSGLCANSYHTYAPDFHVAKAICLLDKLLSAIDEPEEVL